MPEDKLDELERRVDALERRVKLVEDGYVEDERRSRRARAMNMWLRVTIYVMFIVLMVFFFIVFRIRF